jgi:dolichol-phosphate mannosyltransferase
MRELAVADSRVVAVNLSRNYGHQLCLSAGLSLCSGARVLVLDADLQDPPELLGEMMRLMDEGADVVYGQRTERIGESRFKRWSAKRFYRLINTLADVPIPIDAGDFRLMSARVVAILNSMPEQHRFIRGMVSWIGFRQVPLTYIREARNAGQSGYPLRRMLRLAIDAITGFSTRPLRIASLLGMSFAAFGLVGVLITITSWFMGATVPGWASFMVVMLVLGGVQLAVVGILGEYVGRLYLEVKRRPLYLIDEICGAPASETHPSYRERPVEAEYGNI